MRAWILAAACVLASCSAEAPPNAPQTSAEAGQQTDGPTEGLILSCEDFASLTPATLRERFGSENVSVEARNGAEGDTYEATIVFANDPTNRFEVSWNLDGERLATVSVVDAGTQWRGSEGYSVGTSLADVEQMNGRAFQLYGFGWDYGGWVSDWNQGALQYAPTCRAQMQFTPRGREDMNAMGDREFPSDSAVIRAANPAISSFGLVFPTQQ